MGIGVIVHGFIEAYDSRGIFEHNRAVIEDLPEFDRAWHGLVRSMFAVLPLQTSVELPVPQYESLVISFGASYRNMYLLDSEWVTKFEHLLSRLCWHRAVVFNNFSGFRFQWDVPRDQTSRNFADPPLPPTTWDLRCFQLNTTEVPHSRAIDGEYHREVARG